MNRQNKTTRTSDRKGTQAHARPAKSAGAVAGRSTMNAAHIRSRDVSRQASRAT